MLGLLRRILFSKWMLLLGLVITLWHAWTVVRPKPWAPSDLQKMAAENVCWKAAKSIPENLPGLRKLAVLRLAGRDTDGFVTRELAARIQRLGHYDVLHQTLLGNAMKELGIPESSVDTLSDAVSKGRKLGVSGVVFGEVEKFSSDEKSATVHLKITVARSDLDPEKLQQPNPTFPKDRQPFTKSFRLSVNVDTEDDKAEEQDGVDIFAQAPPTPVSGAGLTHAIRSTPTPTRFILWFAFALFLPLLCIPAIKHFLEQESNAVNFAILAALTVADLAVAYVLLGLATLTWLPVLLLVGALAAGGAYNVWLCSTVEKLRH